MIPDDDPANWTITALPAGQNKGRRIACWLIYALSLALMGWVAVDWWLA